MNRVFPAAKLCALATMLFCLAACAPEPPVRPASPQPATPHVTLGASEVITVAARPPQATPMPTPSAEALPGGPACGASDLVYTIDATLDWTTRSVRVTERVAFRNDTGQALDALVLAIPGVIDLENFTLSRVALGDEPPLRDYVLRDAQIILPLPSPLGPGDTTQASLEFSLALQPIRQGYRHGHTGYLGFSARQINLGLWFPQIPAYRQENGWVIHELWPIGESFVLRSADYAVTLRVENGPDGLRVAGPGTFSRPGAQSWRFELCGGRDVSLSVSDQFNLLTTSTVNGISVEVFTLGDSAGGSLEAARYALHTAADAIDLYETRFGPYPFARMAVVEGDFPDGMEFSGLVFVSETWFRTWGGTANDWLALITAHEVSHQWWYAAVGNDQNRDPYLDEALATYSELIFYEHYHPDLVDWWWGFRINNYTPAGYVDVPVTAFEGPRPYINAVYLQGARMLHEMRRTLGDDAFFAWLQRYVSEMHGAIARPGDFWRALEPGQYAATHPIRQQYLTDANVLKDPDSIP
ncbi:MAG: M1 family metallopeptidase [Anaerolineae bacterium]|nr:M1 family metallopeptidase [Anaerolineae bacterium]